MTKQDLRDKLLNNLNYKNWTKKSYAKNVKGEDVSPCSKNAVKWCVAGLACKIARRKDPNLIPVWVELSMDYWAKYKDNLIWANDAKSLKEVKKLLSNLY
jgi:hypothetical protein